MEKFSPKNLLSNWVLVTLNDVAEWGAGGTPSRSKPQFFGGNIPWVKTGELGPKYIRSAAEYISEEGLKKSSAKIFPANSVGIAMYGATIGKVSIWKINASTNQACAVAQPYKKLLNNEYLYYFLFSEKRGLIDAGKGGAQPNISQGILKGWPFFLPPLNEQHRIVAKIEELFSELDKGIESLKTAREQLKVYRQALLKHAFEGKLTEQWRKDNADKLESADDLLARIQQEREACYQQQLENWQVAVKQWEVKGKEGKKPSKPKKLTKFQMLSDKEISFLPELPKGWVWSFLHNTTERIQIGPFGSLLHKEDYVQNQVPLINPSHIKAMRIVPDYNLTVLPKKLRTIEGYLMKQGDIVIGRRGEMGRCAVVTEKEDGWLCGTGSLFVRFLPSLKSEFYCHILSSRRVKDYLSDSSIGTTMQNLNQKILQTVPVPVCSEYEQIEIINEIKKQFSVIENNLVEIDSNIVRTEALRQSILKKAFSGQLVPQDTNDEPASELLKRIAGQKQAILAQEKANKKVKTKARKKPREVNQ